MILPTARAARGRPAIAATSPYVATHPGGIRLTTDRTRTANGAAGALRGLARVTESQQGQGIEHESRRIDRRDDLRGPVLAGDDFPEVDFVGQVDPGARPVEQDPDLGSVRIRRVN